MSKDTQEKINISFDNFKEFIIQKNTCYDDYALIIFDELLD